MLDPDQLQGVAETFGVDESQVLRDHLISHLLAAISAEAAEQIVFFGGTALARSLIPDGRLSEDIDLIAAGTRTAIAQRLTTALPRALRREFPRDLAVSTVVMAGCNFPNCPRATRIKASERDYRVVIAADAISGVQPWHRHEATHIGVLHTTTDAIAANLHSGAQTRSRLA